ncbi:MAG: GTP-binding protein [Candidatus Helarchaeota archaeon]
MTNVEDAKRKAEKLIQKGLSARSDGFFSESIKHWEEVVKIYEELGMEKERANIEIEIANTYWSIGRKKKANEHYDLADEIYEKLGIPKEGRHISAKDREGVPEKKDKEEEKQVKGKYSLKVVVIGEPSVGKSSLIRRFSEDKFDASYTPTIGTDFILKLVDLPDNEVMLTIWDIGGHERFADIRNFYYKGANAAIVVYDLTRRATFKRVNYWYDDITKWTGKKIPIVILGNKDDLDNKDVTDRDIDKMKTIIKGVEWFKTSAKTGENVNDAFRSLAEKCLEI